MSENPNNSETSLQTLPKWRDFRKALITEGEKRYLKDLFSSAGGNIKKAAKMSGLSPPRLYELLRKYRLSN